MRRFFGVLKSMLLNIGAVCGSASGADGRDALGGMRRVRDLTAIRRRR